jgi:hypothetical protein
MATRNIWKNKMSQVQKAISETESYVELARMLESEALPGVKNREVLTALKRLEDDYRYTGLRALLGQTAARLLFCFPEFTAAQVVHSLHSYGGSFEDAETLVYNSLCELEDEGLVFGTDDEEDTYWGTTRDARAFVNYREQIKSDAEAEFADNTEVDPEALTEPTEAESLAAALNAQGNATAIVVPGEQK